MPLFQCGVLLQGERVDLAEAGEVARGLGQALLLLGTHVGMARLSGPGPGVVTGPVIGRFRVHAGDGIGLLDDLGDEHVRSVLLNEGFQLEAELTHGPLGQGLQAHPLLRPGHFLSMGGVGEAAELLGELVDLLANLIGCGQGLGPLGFDGGTLISRLLDAGSGRLGGGASLVPHMRGDGELGAAALLSPFGGGALFPLTARGSSQGVGTPSAGAFALLGRAQCQSGVGLGAAGLARNLRRPLSLLSGALQRALKTVGAMTSYVAHRIHAVGGLALDLGQRGRGGGELSGALDGLRLSPIQDPASPAGLLGGGVDR